MKKEDEVQAIATLIEKQAQIVVKPRMVSEEEKQRKAALLAQYADVTDEEDEADEKDDSGEAMMNVLENLCSKTPMWKMSQVLENWSKTHSGMSPRGRRNRITCRRRGTN